MPRNYNQSAPTKRSQVRGKLEENGQKLRFGIHMYERGETFVKRKLNPLNFLHISKWNFTLLLLSQGTKVQKIRHSQLFIMRTIA